MKAAKQEPHVLGLSSDGWRGSTRAPFNRSTRVEQTHYHGFKTYTYVTRDSAPLTTLHILSPETARFYYTDGLTWNAGPVGRQIARDATTFVSLRSCHSDLTGYPGLLLLVRPACVNIEVIAHHGTRNEHKRLEIPIGTTC